MDLFYSIIRLAITPIETLIILHNTKGLARRPVLLRIVCSLLYEVYHDELERVHLVLGLTVSSGKRCAPVLSFEELSRLF